MRHFATQDSMVSQKKVTGSNGMHFTILDISAASDIKFFHFIKKIEITNFSLCSKLRSLMEK